MAFSTVLADLVVCSSHYFYFIILGFFIARAFKLRYLSPVRDIPALSFIHTISRLGKVREILSGDTHLRQLEAHRKYGRVVHIC